jgi:phosphoribosylformylglycinamidine cyclo-ligase
MTTTPETPASGTTYAAAGVDVEAGDRAVELMKEAVSRTHTAGVFGGVGGFAGMFDVSFLHGYKQPLLATSTDGVGTKVAIAQALDIHDTIGWDLVGMVVDDIVVAGAKPLIMTDYIACGHVVPQRIADIVRGVAEACTAAGVSLVGGETAEHPGLLGPDEYDVAGAATGVVDAADLLGAEKVRAGDVLIGLPSSGLHSNGYSLVRRIIADAGWKLDREVPEFGRTLGEEILTPTHVYSGELLRVLQEHSGAVHSMSHVTGGGLSANVARVLPVGTLATMRRGSWEVPAVFNVLGDLGGVPGADRERTWNLGVGMVLVADAAAADALLAAYPGAWILGDVSTDDGALAGDPFYVQGAKGVDGGAAILLD